MHLFTRVFNNVASVVGKGIAEKAIISSKRYTSQEALAVGLVDKVVPKDEVMKATRSQMDEWIVFGGNSNLNIIFFHILNCAIKN